MWRRAKGSHAAAHKGTAAVRVPSIKHSSILLALSRKQKFQERRKSQFPHQDLDVQQNSPPIKNDDDDDDDLGTKSPPVVFLHHRTRRPTHDYPPCLDLDCMFVNFEPFQREVIDPEKLVENLRADRAAAAAARAGLDIEPGSEAEDAALEPVDDTTDVEEFTEPSVPATSDTNGDSDATIKSSTAALAEIDTIAANLDNPEDEKTINSDIVADAVAVTVAITANPDPDIPQGSAKTKAVSFLEQENPIDRSSHPRQQSGASSTCTTDGSTTEFGSYTESMAMDELHKSVQAINVLPDGRDCDRHMEWFEAEEFRTGPNTEALRTMSEIVRDEADARAKIPWYRRVKNFFANMFTHRARHARITRENSRLVTEAFRKALLPNLTDEQIRQAQFQAKFTGALANVNAQLRHSAEHSTFKTRTKPYKYIQKKNVSDSATPPQVYSEQEGRGPSSGPMQTSNIFQTLRSYPSSTTFSELSVNSSTEKYEAKSSTGAARYRRSLATRMRQAKRLRRKKKSVSGVKK